MELYWKNAEGLQLRALHWPVDNPRAVIALVHGQGEHIGRYEHLARWFNQHNVAVLGYDHQGYGKSQGKPGHAQNLDVLLDDIGLLLEQTRERYPELPVFLYGHSLGGHLTLNFMLRRQAAVTGHIASAPWIRLAFEQPAVKVWLGRLIRRVLPKLTLPTGLNSRYLSRDKTVVEAYNNDPLVHDKISAAAGIDLLEGAHWLNRYAGAYPAPLLLMHGADDQITAPAASLEFAGRLIGNIRYQSWPGLYHEIHNEPEQETVFAYTWEWMEKFLA